MPVLPAMDSLQLQLHGDQTQPNPQSQAQIHQDEGKPRLRDRSKQSATFPTRPHRTQSARGLCAWRQPSTKEIKAGSDGAPSPGHRHIATR